MSEEKLREYLKRVTSDLHRSRLRVKELEEQRPETIAIVGMACRFPGGATSPARLWELLERGGDAVADFPPDRGWDIGELLELGVAPVGGFLPKATEFDAGFFGISPREALAMDPQQRVALECTWEALENAGVDPTGLRGSDAGVFMGTNGQDYAAHVNASADAGDLVGHVATGNAASVLSGRVAYVLGLEGPSVSVDTACSSSLVALHWAVQALRRGECSLALTGGVTIMSTVGAFAEFAHQGGLAADGRCKAFSDDADGTGWGEGVGVLVMERLTDAERLGHRVLAVVRGSAVNSDGASSSLTAPNGPSQQRVIQRALAEARLAPADVDAVEAHGTGTKLGDPIEAQALMATYGQDRADGPLWLGSIKSNIGHTQAAAGVAGVIKMIEAMRHRVLPGTLHAGTPSTQVDWSMGAVEVLKEARPWEADRPRRAGVSSFGISGTNAHVILEEGPDAARAAEPVTDPRTDSVVPWVLSARDADALAAQVERLKEVPGSAVDIGWSLATTRAALEERAVVVGADRDELMAGLEGLMVRGRVTGEGRVGIVFSGQGSQRAGMGQELSARFSVFEKVFEEICGHFDIPVAEAMRTGDLLDETRYTQAALFAYEVAMFRLLESWGVRADVLLGHSIGEIAAAYVAGVWSLEDACRLVAARGRLMSELPPGGSMVSLEAGEDEVEPLLTANVSIAAVNGPRAVVISGAEDEVGAIAARFDRAKRLKVSHAFHSPLMDPMLKEFRRVAEGLTYAEPSIPVISNLTGQVVSAELTDPGYWVRHVREAVRFADGVRAMAARGVDAIAEIAPKPVLSSVVREITDVVVAPLTRKALNGDWATLAGLGHLWAHGVGVDWSAVFDGLSPRTVELPNYPFQRRRFWPEPIIDNGDSWRYEVSWTPTAPPMGRPAGTWAVVTGEGAGSAACVEELRSRGAEVTELALSGLGREAVAERLAEIRPSAVVALLGGADEPAEALWELVVLGQGLAGSGVEAPLWVVTRGAVAAVDGDDVSPASAGLWGLGRVFGLEHAAAWGGLVDVADDESWSRVTDVIVAADENEVAVRPSGLLARRLVPQRLASSAGAPELAGGTVLVTGGTGSLGSRVARWLGGRGVSRLVLAGRSGRRTEAVAALESALPGVRIEVAACDVADPAAVRGLVAGLDDLRGVVHAAGVVDDLALLDLDRAAFDQAVRAKVLGGWNLHEAAPDVALFVTFSSISGVWGASGQAAYAAGNAFLDGLIAYRRGQGLAGTSVAWGPWAGGGMAASDEIAQALNSRGLRLMRPESAVTALARSVDHGLAHSVVADVDWPRLVGMFDMVGLAGLFADVRAAEEADPDPADGGLAEVPEDERPGAVTAIVREQVAGVLGYAGPEAVAMDRPFRDLGFDSLTAVEFRDRLRTSTGLKVGSTVVYDHPTPGRLVEHILGLLAPAPARRAVSAATTPVDEPVAIVGMACRLPGGISSPEQLWSLVESGGEAIGPFPSDRGWDPSMTGSGGFLYDAAEFDAGFFGISPREALAMDPQQRLVLECSWEALERAGIDPDSLRGTDAGVFLGLSHQDYGPRLHEPSDEAEGYLLTGSAQGVASGRVAYVLGLEGPAVSVDTACSSSLVSLHLAAQALRRGECTLALAGGVMVMATPGAFAEFGRQGGLAADGRCKAFSDSADGTGWSEGAGIIAVERLSDAKRLGHPVLAVVRGSAMNQDGASNGLTAPNGPAQQRVIERALADAGLRPSDIDAVEAHGTGTRLGDPIEAQALLATYGQDRPDGDPLWMGSLKSNLGHTQAAAGVSGIIKMVQAMRNGVLPRTLHAEARSSHVDWDAGAVELLTEARRWPERERPRRAGVSAFGLSGTNAHVILEQDPEPEPAEPSEQAPDDVVVPWVFSAKTAEALDGQAARLAGARGTAVDVGWSLATTRAELAERAVVVGAGRDELRTGLRALTIRGRAEGEGRIGVVFSGQGSQRAGMGEELRARFPVFAETFDEVCSHFDIDIAEAMRTGESLDETRYTQAALFAYEVATHCLLESWGIEPEVLLGHSIGEISAAYVAGVWSIEDACALVAARGRLMQELPSGGAMISLQATEEEVAPLLTDGVSIAAVNGPRSVVVSGAEDEVEAVAAALPDRKAKRLRVSHAFHSPLMEPMLEEFRRVAEGLTYHEPVLPVVSNVTGRLAGTELTDPEYWVRHVREAVRFADGVRAMAEHGVDAYAEIGPSPVLSSAIHELGDVTVAPMARDKVSEDRAVLAGVGRLWVSGAHVDWDTVFDGLRPSRVDLPTYAFKRERFWLAPSVPEETPAADQPFWEAVHRLDAAHLATELGIGDTAGLEGLETLLPALSEWRRRREDDALLDDMRYGTEWVATDPAPGNPGPDDRWLVVVGGEGHRLEARVLRTMTECGMRTETLTVEPGDDRASLAGRVDDLGGEFDGVLSLLAVGSGQDAGPDVPLLAATLALFQALGDAGVTAPLWCVTREAVGLGGDPVDPARAPLWGFGRSAALEAPQRWGGMVDLPDVPAGFQLERLCALLTSPDAEDQLLIRANTTFARRLVRRQAPSVADTWEPRGTVLVTGGTGALGKQVARWLADRGAEHILLLSRSGTEAGWVAELRERTEVTVARCDVADETRLREVLDGIPEHLPLRAVIHAAGVLDDGVLDAMKPDQLATVLAPKAAGAWNLHRLTSDLDRFIMFSSVAATWGNAGQANYAAANAYLDALARHRHAHGQPAGTIAWGPWADGGMAADDAVTRRMARAGMTALRPDQALKALRQVLDSGETDVTVIDLDWSRFVTHHTASRPSGLFANLAVQTEQVAEEQPALPSLADLKPAERERVLLKQVRGTIAAVLAYGSADAVGPRQRFTDLGFDSLTAVELRNQLTAATGLELPATLVFDFPTPADLADELSRRLAPETTGETGETGEADDEAVRVAINSIPLQKLREAGLLDVLLSMGSESGEETAPTLDDEFESMNAQDLIRLALGDEG